MFGLMTRRAHMREVVRMAEAYRWERDQAQAEAQGALSDLDRMLNDLATGVDISTVHESSSGRKRITVTMDIDPRVSRVAGEHVERLAHHITLSLLGYKRDHRPDMRDPNPERLSLIA